MNKLLIYYAWPSAINGSATLEAAADEFSKYRYVVLGGALVEDGHGDQANTREIIDKMKQESPKTKVFGYVDIGVTNGGSNFGVAEMKERIDKWVDLGATGIFLDNFGFDFGVSRKRQNKIVRYVHKQSSLPVIANAWKPEDVFEPHRDEPDGELLESKLTRKDFYLSESFWVSEGEYAMPGDVAAKAEKLKDYQAKTKFQILSVTTNSNTRDFDKEKFNFAWCAAYLDGHAAMGWGEYQFSATTELTPSGESTNGYAPYRRRPQRDRYDGPAQIDPETHRYGFENG